MRFTAHGETFELDPQRLMFAEARAVEKVTGLTFKEYGGALSSGSMTAMQAFMWVAAKRVHPELTFSDLDEWEVSDFALESEGESEGEATDPT